jgi:hypothetical protein
LESPVPWRIIQRSIVWESTGIDRDISISLRTLRVRGRLSAPKAFICSVLHINLASLLMDNLHCPPSIDRLCIAWNILDVLIKTSWLKISNNNMCKSNIIGR